MTIAADVPRQPENPLLNLSTRLARWQILAIAGVIAVVGAVLDYLVGVDVSLGALYVIPAMIVATVMRRVQIVAVAVVLGVLCVVLNPTKSDVELVFRFLLAFLAYMSAGFFVAELVDRRVLVMNHLQEIQRQQQLRREAEEQLSVLAESSPAAIVTLDSSGRVLAANRAAHELFAFSREDQLLGEDISSYLPVLADALKLDTGQNEFRTAAQCHGRRRSGELFIAQTWFSTYVGPGGRRLAAIAVDSSEEVRDREEQNLHLLLRSNRVLAGAVSHEIRNLCSGIAVVHSNLKREAALRNNEDFRTLGALVEGLGHVAAMEIRNRRRQDIGSVDLGTVLDLLRIVIGPAWQEIGGTLTLEMPKGNIAVAGDSTGLLQVFLNLAHNSHRAVQTSSVRRLCISVIDNEDMLCVRFRDSGPGVSAPEKLFRAFQEGAEGSGMGLFVSRAMIRTWGGELRYEQDCDECCFTVELQTLRRAQPVGV
jgi:two-component system sensor kinase FixL